MSYQGKKSIPHITVSRSLHAASRCPRSFVSGVGKGVRRERSGRSVPGGWRREPGRLRVCGRASPRLDGCGRRCPLLLLLELRAGSDLILCIIFLCFRFPSSPHSRGSALRAVSPAWGRRRWVAAGRAGGRLATGAGGAGGRGRRCRPPEEQGPGRLVHRARQNKRGRGRSAVQRAPATAPRQRAGAAQPPRQRGQGAVGQGGPGVRRDGGGKRRKSKSAMMPAPTSLRAINTSDMVGIRSQRVNHNHPLPICACLLLDAFIPEQDYNRECFPCQKERI